MNALWTPSPERAENAQISRFQRAVEAKYRLGCLDYPDFHLWSVEHPDLFWQEVWDFTQIIASKPATRVFGHRVETACPRVRQSVPRRDLSRNPASRDTTPDRSGAEPRRETVRPDIWRGGWFPGARLNFAENLLRFRDDGIAIIARTETGARVTYTFSELADAVAGLADALRAAGVRQGDRVAGFLPNIPEAVIAMLAAASLGAIWSSCSPDFGIKGVLDRFGQIAPKVLFACDGYRYNGKPIDTRERVARIVQAIPEIERVVMVPGIGLETADRGSEVGNGGHARSQPPASSLQPPACALTAWDDFTTKGHGGALTFEPLPFDHPLYIMYSSGTTGVPKCIVHGAGGTLLQHRKEHALHCDLSRGDRLFYFTTCGWMMWNWLTSALAGGTAIVLYEGSPSHPDMSALWRMAEEEGVTHFGTSPKFVASCERAGLTPGQSQDLAALRCVLSTGSPLSVENFRWIHEQVKEDAQIASICGGTDIISCFMLGHPALPVYEGQIQCLGLGMAVDAFDDQGRAVRGEKGELVCTKPFPSMPVAFWNDEGGRKYHDAYFSRWPGVWHHGDFVEITAQHGVIVHGRSDATLNPGGVRIGTAEIDRIVETIPEVLDSLVIGHQADNDVEVVLFVVPRAGVSLDEALVKRIKAAIRAEATPRHVPGRIFAITAVPRTISGKKVELAVTQLVHGKEVKNRDALANPEALDQFVGILERDQT